MQTLAAAVELAGFSTLVLAAWLIAPSAGLVVLGVGLLAVGWGIGAPRRDDK